MMADWRERGLEVIRAQASVLNERALQQLAAIAGVDVDALVESRDFPAPLSARGCRGRYYSRDALLGWWRTR